MATEVQEPYNLFAQQKQQYYPGTQNQQQQQTVLPGQVQGATVQDFANGKAAANSQAGMASQPVTTPVTPVNTTATDSGKTMGIRSGEWDNEPMKRGGYTQPITSMDDLARAMGYTSPQEEERLRKASVANQRIMAVGDALRHIGNIYNTVNYAPAQKFNNPVLEEQARYERGKALRDKANYTYLNYQQQKAAQDAKQRQWEAEQKAKAEKDARDFAFNVSKYKNDFEYKRDKDKRDYEFNQQKEKRAAEQWQKAFEQKEKQHKQSLGVQWYNAKTSRMNAERMAKGGGRGNNTVTLRGKNGFYSKNMDSNELNSFYNQTYQEMKNRGIINEGNVLAGLPADIFGNKSLSQTAIKQAVDQALLQHPEVGDWLSDEFEFEFDPRYEEGTYAAPKPNFGYTPEWRKQKDQKDAQNTFGFGNMSGFTL